MILESKYIKDIDLAQNGYEGYKKLIEKKYDLVICDLIMPVMDGFRFCENAVLHFKDQNNIFKSSKNLNSII